MNESKSNLVVLLQILVSLIFYCCIMQQQLEIDACTHFKENHQIHDEVDEIMMQNQPRLVENKLSKSIVIQQEEFQIETKLNLSRKIENISKYSYQNLKKYRKLIKNGKSKSEALQALLTSSSTKKSIFCTLLSPNDCKISKTHPYRSINGTCNNIENPGWGSSLSPFSRLLPPNYARVGIDDADVNESNVELLPNVRLISSTIHKDVNKSDVRITNLLTQFGQFLGHDMSLTSVIFGDCCKQANNSSGSSSKDKDDSCWPIKVFKNDTFYSKLSPEPQTCLEFSRSTPYCFPTNSGVREQMNGFTSFLDLSQVYGSDIELAPKLRQFSAGRLKHFAFDSNNNNNKSSLLLLPTKAQVHGDVGKEFAAGDNFRVNENPWLTTLHTLFLREHNRIAHEIHQRRQDWSDEIIFQETRRLIIAEYQNIIYDEYLPIILGSKSMTQNDLNLPSSRVSNSDNDNTNDGVNDNYNYIDSDENLSSSSASLHTNYNSQIDPTIINSFTTAAFRFGHSLAHGMLQLKRQGSNGVSTIHHHPLRDHFLRSQFWDHGPNNSTQTVDSLLNGLMNQKAQTCDVHVTQELTNHLFKPSNKNYGSDLIARNIQRGRDHGLPSYAQYRSLCGLSNITTAWSSRPKEIDSGTWNKYRSLYQSPQDIDLYSGGLAESPATPDSIPGPTFNCLISKQFFKLKFGDRYFFTHSSPQPKPFTTTQLQVLRGRKLRDIICENSHIKATALNVFKPEDDALNPRINCNDKSSRHQLRIEEFVPLDDKDF